MRWTVTFAFATVRAVHRRRLPALQAHLGSPPHAIGGRKDAFLNAETGTGKTLAYLLPLFTRIDPT
jgi:superfamily II DNA/RNA helicase